MSCIVHISILSDTRQSLKLGFHPLGWKQVSKYQIFNKKEQLFETSPYKPNYVFTFCTIQSLKETPQLFFYLFYFRVNPSSLQKLTVQQNQIYIPSYNEFCYKNIIARLEIKILIFFSWLNIFRTLHSITSQTVVN